ncbi:hypothetical protein GCM10010218_27490 [Streptomyces mashuensis]|uniref:Uncharacterized protein n=1 Tax=Streptomyces mashuensis TaxID=33904 RepID=A0A919EBV2_9ACTN|nr:hypothetical protein [Streptomyces mashuensis]GHF44578.1 hypothetical protein GCM10010218_27490 [Streptomyces mashuensis]
MEEAVTAQDAPVASPRVRNDTSRPASAQTAPGRQPEHSRGLLAPVLVNLALGVPAMLPLYLAWWLLTAYLPMDCHTLEEAARPDVTNCHYTTVDHAGPVMFLLAVTGALLLAVALVVDVVLPLRRGRRLRPWLGAAALIPVPYALAALTLG